MYFYVLQVHVYTKNEQNSNRLETCKDIVFPAVLQNALYNTVYMYLCIQYVIQNYSIIITNIG